MYSFSSNVVFEDTTVYGISTDSLGLFSLLSTTLTLRNSYVHTIEVEPAFMQKAYRDKIQKHIASIEEAANGIRADHVLLDTSEPLDKALHNYLTFREKRG